MSVEPAGTFAPTALIDPGSEGAIYNKKEHAGHNTQVINSLRQQFPMWGGGIQLRPGQRLYINDTIKNPMHGATRAPSPWYVDGRQGILHLTGTAGNPDKFALEFERRSRHAETHPDGFNNNALKPFCQTRMTVRDLLIISESSGLHAHHVGKDFDLSNVTIHAQGTYGALFQHVDGMRVDNLYCNGGWNGPTGIGGKGTLTGAKFERVHISWINLVSRLHRGDCIVMDNCEANRGILYAENAGGYGLNWNDTNRSDFVVWQEALRRNLMPNYGRQGVLYWYPFRQGKLRNCIGNVFRGGVLSRWNLGFDMDETSRLLNTFLDNPVVPEGLSPVATISDMELPPEAENNHKSVWPSASIRPQFQRKNGHVVVKVLKGSFDGLKKTPYFMPFSRKVKSLKMRPHDALVAEFTLRVDARGARVLLEGERTERPRNHFFLFRFLDTDPAHLSGSSGSHERGIVKAAVFSELHEIKFTGYGKRIPNLEKEPPSPRISLAYVKKAKDGDLIEKGTSRGPNDDYELTFTSFNLYHLRNSELLQDSEQSDS